MIAARRKLNIRGILISEARLLTAPAFLFSRGQLLLLLFPVLEFLRVYASVNGFRLVSWILVIPPRILLVAAVINICRYILLGETPRVHFGPRGVAYFFKSLIPEAPLYVMQAIWYNVFYDGVFDIVMQIGMILFAGLGFVFLRYCVPMNLAMAAVAIDRKFSFGDALAAARGNIRPLAGVALAYFLILFGGYYTIGQFLWSHSAILAMQMGWPVPLVPELVISLFATTFVIVCTYFSAGFLALSYATLVDRNDDVAEIFG